MTQSDVSNFCAKTMFLADLFQVRTMISSQLCYFKGASFDIFDKNSWNAGYQNLSWERVGDLLENLSSWRNVTRINTLLPSDTGHSQSWSIFELLVGDFEGKLPPHHVDGRPLLGRAVILWTNNPKAANYRRLTPPEPRGNGSRCTLVLSISPCMQFIVQPRCESYNQRSAEKHHTLRFQLELKSRW